jgi:antitoxin (DNA-binding transcriptional repressor) of toxin-antitoxin stability system
MSEATQLLDRAAAGEEIVIARAGRPVARLVALAEPPGQRIPGGWRGKVSMTADFDAEGLTIVTRDKRFSEYGVALLPA